jgi:hypothetical protein
MFARDIEVRKMLITRRFPDMTSEVAFGRIVAAMFSQGSAVIANPRAHCSLRVC